MKKIPLRTVFSFLIINLSFLSSKAQWVSIPDTNFGAFLNTYYTACMQGNSQTGWQMDTTCPAVAGDTSFYCFNSNISDLTGIQYFDGLATLDCSANQLSSLPALPAGLTELRCQYNQLTSLPALPTGLTELRCQFNQLTSLPALPAGLWWLSCYNNQLASLPALPADLFLLQCSINQLTSLPALPAGLTWLECAENQLTSLPALPSGLTKFFGQDNDLTSLPALPSGLTDLECHGNQLTSLPELPDSLYFLYIYNNPITCLPKLNKIYDIIFDSTLITCVPNYGNVTISNPPLSSLPLCDSANANGCAYCHAFFSVFPDSLNEGVYNGFNQSYGSNLTSYLWEFGDGDTSSLPYPSHNYAQPGQYYVCLTVSSADCINTYCDSSFYVFKTAGGLMSELHIINTATAVTDISGTKAAIRLSPNPASNTVTISVDGSMIGGTVTVSDITGRKIMAVHLPSANYPLSTVDFASGAYFVTVANKEGKSASKKLIIQK